jgi:hypothetical protein
LGVEELTDLLGQALAKYPDSVVQEVLYSVLTYHLITQLCCDFTQASQHFVVREAQHNWQQDVNDALEGIPGFDAPIFPSDMVNFFVLHAFSVLYVY